ncbi:hypothetical protein EQ500_02240 [Lactobacillus sp. XV13L]|nr:hypothetical protein [Lactobacillus sp. XV13L]
MARRLHGVQIQSLFQRFEQDQTTYSPALHQIRQYKDSLDFVTALQAYGRQADLTQAFCDVIFEGRVFFKKEEIQSLYHQLPQALSSADKFLQTKNALIKKLQHHLHQQEQADWVLEALDNMSEAQYQQITQQLNLENYTSSQQQQLLARKFLKDYYRPVYAALYNDYFFDIFKLYQNFLQHVRPDSISSTTWQEMIADVNDNLEHHYLQLDDASALLYLQQLVTGSGQNQRIKYLFIDEMQDYSAMQLAYIQHSFPNAKLTLLGDIEQNVYAHQQLSQKRFETLTHLFPQKKAALITLNQSYRATAAITNLAKQFIPSGAQIQAFNRAGELPTLWISDAESCQAKTLQLAQEFAKKYRSVAIITKTQQQAQKLSDIYQNQASLLTEQNSKIPDGIVILPVYLAKGLEFDCVIGYDVSTQNYSSSNDWGILYTIATRALHQLNFTCNQQPATIFQQVQPQSLHIKII